MNRYIEAVRALARGQQPKQDISDLLRRHNCHCLLARHGEYGTSADGSGAESILNKISVHQRLSSCAELFRLFGQKGIPYAVIKGAVLSEAAYSDPCCRRSGDIDLLIDRSDVDAVKSIMLSCGFVQGRVTEKGIEPFSRRELLFQTAMTHQAAPFIKETGNRLCPYVNVDVNLDIMWGESAQHSDMEFVLKNTRDAVIFGVPLRKLTDEIEFISLCLHHYKDMNSLYLLYGGGLKLSLFCDIYFYLKNRPVDPQKLLSCCERLGVGDYVYYCLYHTEAVFSDGSLSGYLSLLHSERAEELLDMFGLAENERQRWEVDLFTRLFETDIRGYLDRTLNEEAKNKIRLNSMLM